MWHSEADIIDDLATLNDFGEPGNTEPYKILCSVGRGSKTSERTKPQSWVNSRTGEEISLGNECLSLEDLFCKGKGRGAALGTKSYSLLQKQLRLAKPLGSSDEIIEAYCRRNEEVKTPILSNFHDTNVSENSDTANSNEIKSRVKAVRSSNVLNNALLTSLLKAKEVSSPNPEIDKSKEAIEPDILDENNKICPASFKNGEIGNHKVFPYYSNSDDSSSYFTSEDATSESLCDFFQYNSREKVLGKINQKSNKIRTVDLAKYFNVDLSFSDEDEDEVEVSLTNENGIQNISLDTDFDENHERNQSYQKLGEKLNRMTVFCDQKKRKGNSFSENPEWANKTFGTQNRSDIKFENHFVLKESDFPPLSKK